MQLHTVEAYFIEPLKAYFEKDPKDGAEAFIVEKLDGSAPNLLDAAVEWIKANRQAQSSFPSPKECFAAIEAVRPRVERPLATAEFNPSMSYGDKLKAWMTKLQAKSYPVIHKGTHEWTEWEIYFLATENKVQYPLMRNKETWTVPALLPVQFDPKYDWAKGDRLLRERVEFERESDTPERQAFVREQLKRLRF